MLTIRLKTRRSVVVMENGALKYGSNNNNNEILEEKVVSTFLASFLESFKLAIINTWTCQVQSNLLCQKLSRVFNLFEYPLN